MALWFTISPVNDVAVGILDDPSNRHFVSTRPGGSKVISVTFDDHLNPDFILAFGRAPSPGVIVCSPPTIPNRDEEEVKIIGGRFSRSQCRFLLSNDSLIFRDDSSGLTSWISPREHEQQDLWSFSGGPRQRALLEVGIWDIQVGPAEFELDFPENFEQWWNRNAKGKAWLASRLLKIPMQCNLTAPDVQLPATRYQTRVQT